MECEIKLDYDMKEKAFVKHMKRIAIGLILLPFITVKEVKVNQTKKGFHTLLKIESEKFLLDNDIVALQAILGSDYKREAFNLFSVKQGMINWNQLFSRKWKMDKEGKTILISKETLRQDLGELLKKKVSMEVA
jgi:hypothetical protein